MSSLLLLSLFLILLISFLRNFDPTGGFSFFRSLHCRRMFMFLVSFRLVYIISSFPHYALDFVCGRWRASGLRAVAHFPTRKTSSAFGGQQAVIMHHHALSSSSFTSSELNALPACILRREKSCSGHHQLHHCVNSIRDSPCISLNSFFLLCDLFLLFACFFSLMNLADFSLLSITSPSLLGFPFSSSPVHLLPLPLPSLILSPCLRT